MGRQAFGLFSACGVLTLLAFGAASAQTSSSDAPTSPVATARPSTPGEWTYFGAFHSTQADYRLFGRITEKHDGRAAVTLREEFDKPLAGYMSASLSMEISCPESASRVLSSVYFKSSNLEDRGPEDDKPTGWLKPDPSTVPGRIVKAACSAADTGPMKAPGAGLQSAAGSFSSAPAAAPATTASIPPPSARPPVVAAAPPPTTPALRPTVGASEAPSSPPAASASSGPRSYASLSPSRAPSRPPVEAPAHPPRRPAREAAAPSGAAEGGSKVQLGAFASEALASAGERKIERTLGGKLSPHTFGIETAEVNGSKVYRLELAGFASVSEASRYCSDLKRSGLSCFARP